MHSSFLYELCGFSLLDKKDSAYSIMLIIQAKMVLASYTGFVHWMRDQWCGILLVIFCIVYLFLLLGRMRCLAALARWEELNNLCKEYWTPAEPAARLEMAPMVCIPP